jgi:hypothetical protein
VRDAFISAVKDALKRQAGLAEFREILREHRDLGLTRQDACDALEGLRGGMDESTEDRVLEVLDVASGFCAPHLRVWPE